MVVEPSIGSFSSRFAAVSECSTMRAYVLYSRENTWCKKIKNHSNFTKSLKMLSFAWAALSDFHVLEAFWSQKLAWVIKQGDDELNPNHCFLSDLRDEALSKGEFTLEAPFSPVHGLILPGPCHRGTSHHVPCSALFFSSLKHTLRTEPDISHLHLHRN